MDGQQHIMSDREFFQEIVWEKLQQGEYCESNGIIYDFNTGELICSVSDMA